LQEVVRVCWMTLGCWRVVKAGSVHSRSHRPLERHLFRRPQRRRRYTEGSPALCCCQAAALRLELSLVMLKLRKRSFRVEMLGSLCGLSNPIIWSEFFLLLQEGFAKERELFVGLQPPEAFRGFVHRGCSPAHRHRRRGPALHVSADASYCPKGLKIMSTKCEKHTDAHATIKRAAAAGKASEQVPHQGSPHHLPKDPSLYKRPNHAGDTSTAKKSSR
jgi:hypothetical protein